MSHVEPVAQLIDPNDWDLPNFRPPSTPLPRLYLPVSTFPDFRQGAFTPLSEDSPEQE